MKKAILAVAAIIIVALCGFLFYYYYRESRPNGYYTDGIDAEVVGVTNSYVTVLTLESGRKGVKAGDTLALMLPTVGVSDDVSDGETVHVVYDITSVKKKNGSKVIENVYRIYRINDH